MSFFRSILKHLGLSKEEPIPQEEPMALPEVNDSANAEENDGQDCSTEIEEAPLDAPEMPEALEEPEMPEALEEPEIPEALEEPEMSEALEEPEMPEALEEPEMPEEN